MRKYILFFLLLAFTLNATAQTQITRKPKKEQSAAKPKPKPSNKPAAKPKPKPPPAPAPRPAAPVEAAGYYVTFSCNAPGARIEVDGTSIVSDAGSLFLRTGSHTLRVTAEGY